MADRSDDLLEIGRIVKPHGIRGEVVVAPITNRLERFRSGAVHVVRGVDFVVAAARPHQGRWLVRYEQVADRSAAEELRGVVVEAETMDLLDEGEVWVHELVGRVVVDQTGVRRGRVTAVEVNPAHDLLVLDSGALVPMVFVRDTSGDLVSVDVPEGLFAEE